MASPGRETDAAGRPLRAQLVLPVGRSNIALEGKMPCRLLYNYQVRMPGAEKHGFVPTRFGDGDLSESVEVPKNLDFRLLRSSDANMQIVYTGYLKTGLAFDERARPVGFCDFASAGNTAGRDSFYRVWLPETK